MLSISDIAVEGRRVLIREDLNVPLGEDGEITDATRINAAVPTIKDLITRRARVLVMAHLGRPTEGEPEPRFSLAPVAKALSDRLGQPVRLVSDWLDGVDVAAGEVVLCENVRFLQGEKKNDPDLSRRYAKLCDIYVNDAFGTAHRAQASTHGVATYAPIACAGPLLLAEVEALAKAIANPVRPVVAVVGGSKVSTKLDVLTSLVEMVDTLVVGGGIANTFLKARGEPIGNSLCEDDMLDTARALLERAKERGAELPLPSDVTTATEFSATAVATTKGVSAVASDDLILDVGPESADQIAQVMAQAGTIIWNGPLGVFEFDGFARGTKVLTDAIARSNAFSLAGGGDTIAAINKFGAADQISYISTGGGAFLEFLEGKTLPAIAVLEERARANPHSVHPSEPHA